MREGYILKDHIKGGALTEVTYLTLLALFTPRHGYEIMKFIRECTDGRVILGAGTLYGAIHTLEKKQLIALVGSEVSDKKVYQVTEAGKQAVEQELLRLKQVHTLGVQIVYGGEQHE